MAKSSGGAFDPNGPVAQEIAWLTWLLVALGLVAFAVFAAALAIGLLRGRESDQPAERHRPDRFILFGGVVFPAVVLVATMALTVHSMRETSWQAPEGALVIEVTGHQWWYEVRYPEAGVETANEVHLPAGRPVVFELTSADVIHSFWIPELGGKLDMLPGDRNRLVLQADEPAVYRSQCAEFCGLQHAKMGLVAVVEPPEAFERWLAEQAGPAAAPAAGPGQRGRELFLTAGCGSCHTVRGTAAGGAAGPDLTHLASRRTLGAATVPLTTADLRRWVSDPHATKEGVKMPASDLSDGELDALVRYLEGLR